MSFWTWTVAELRDRAASPSPTPGGGAVSVVCGSLGLALIQMAIAISRRKSEALAPLAAEAEQLQTQLAVSADADAAVLEAFMSALRLPKANDQRGRALSQAAADATRAPLAAARQLVSALSLGLRAQEGITPQVASDLVGGVDLLHGSLVAVLRNVDINLPHIEDAELRRSLAEERDALRSEGARLYESIIE